MAEFPYLPLFTDAYLADTNHLTLEEHGLYTRMLMMAWRMPDCALPADDRTISRYMGISPRVWRRLKPRMLEFWTETDGRLIQKRLRKEWQRLAKVSAKQSLNARGKSLNQQETDAAYHTHTHTHNKPPSRPPTGGDSDVIKAFDNWNTTAEHLGLAPGIRLTLERKRKLQRILAEFGLAGWNQALTKLADQPFLLGENTSGWRITLDYMLKPGTVPKIIEGAYGAAANKGD